MTPERVAAAIEKVKTFIPPEEVDLRSAVANCHNPGLVAGMLSCVERGHPKLAVEIGTCFGFGAMMLGKVCQQVVTIDVHLDPRVQEVLAMFHVTNVAQVVVPNDAAKSILLGALDFDFAFIDGCHEQAAVALDFALTRKCRTVVFHDYWDKNPGVKSVVDSIADGVLFKGYTPFVWWTPE